MALPRILWNYPALCWLLAVPIPGSLGLECGEHQYRFHEKCCSDCAPGQRMRSRCTASADTACSPCQDGYFSPQHHHGFCRSCTVCSARRGSVEVKPCEKTSDRECECRAGFAPRGRECSPCPEGTFSRGRNEKCQPWTNCSSFGMSTIRAGTATEDAQCSTPGLDPRPPGKGDPRPPGVPGKGDPRPSGVPGKGDPRPPGSPAPLPTELPPLPGEVPAVPADPGSPAEPGWGSLSLLLLCLMLLLVSGISILLLILQAAQKKTRNGSGRSIQHTQRSCRVPIQEEQIDPSSSLIKN